MTDQPASSVSTLTPEPEAPRQRSIVELMAALQTACDVIWNGGKARPSQHVWSIPVDKERDFDCILGDGIAELAALRAQVQTLTAERDEWKRKADCPMIQCPYEQQAIELRARLAALEGDLKTNAAMLARQCDLTREAETQAMQARTSLTTCRQQTLAEAIRLVQDVDWNAESVPHRDELVAALAKRAEPPQEESFRS